MPENPTEPALTKNARQYYEASRQNYIDRLIEIRKWDRRLVLIRLGLFSSAGTAFFLAVSGAPGSVFWYVLGGILVVAFVVAARADERNAEQRAEAKWLKTWHEMSLARIDRHWKYVREFEVQLPESDRDVANDLDLFGHASLFQLLNRAWTPRGRATLARWLVHPAKAGEISLRNSAVEQLADEQSLRERLALLGGVLSDSLAGPEAMIAWAGAPAWYAPHRWLIVLTRTLSILMISLLIGWAVTGMQSMAIGIVAVVGANLIVCIGWNGAIHSVFDQVSGRHREVCQYGVIFQLLLSRPFSSPKLVQLRSVIENHEHGPIHAMTILARIMSLASLRHAGLLSLLHIVLQLTILWDFHICRLLDSWKGRYGRYVEDWFDSLGQLESLASLAALKHDNPDWCFPEIDAKDPIIRANQLGHPLLSDRQRVRNDVSVGPPGTVLLITGSNMSGKSTLLRAIGVNVALAQAGGPVCATRFRIPPVTLATSIRVRDSLEEGVSYFLAELRQLKRIVDRAVTYQTHSDRTLLYLLDEILQGTNSKERHIAVCQVVAHLVECGAIGAITTHDLDLATSPDLQQSIRPVHFRETLHEDADQTMTFDYQLREGIASTTNALKLLALVGLRKNA